MRWAATALLGCAVGLLAPPAGADAIVVSRAVEATTLAEVFVEDGRVRVELEIGLRDLGAFRQLLPDALHEQLGYGTEPLPDRLARFATEAFVVRAEGGPPLPGRVTRAEPRARLRRDEITGEPLPAPGDGEAETVVFATVEYPLPGRPASLSLAPPRTPGARPATLGFVLYHAGLPVNDFRYLGREELVDLDWEDPWYSRFRNRNLRRQYDAPLSVFLYVEPYEVRYEIIARPRDLQRWVDLGLEGRDRIPVALQPEVLSRVAAFLGEHLTASIDAAEVTPTLDRIHFLRRTLRRSTVVDPPQELDLVSATLGAVFVVPTSGLPREAALIWDLYPRSSAVYAAATDEAGPLPTRLTPDSPVLRWQNFLKHPTLPTLVAPPDPVGRATRLAGGAVWLAWPAFAALALWQRAARRRGRASKAAGGAAVAVLAVALVTTAAAGRSRIDDAEAAQILSALLHNVYRAFDFRDEGAVYDVLARSVDGELLADLYLETRRGLELASQGGARVKVKDVTLESVDSEARDDGPGFAARAAWTVSGSVGHWGHVHQRRNRYEARFAVEPLEGAWKITRLDLTLEERL